MHVRIGVIGTPPGVMPCALDRRCPSRGFAVDAVRAACSHLNLSCTYQWFRTTEYGDADDNGTGTGLVGAIQHNEYDTSVPVFTPTFKRYRAITFSDIYFYFDVLFVTRRPTQELPLFNWGVIHSFDWQIWCVFITCLLLTTLVVSCVVRFFAHTNRTSVVPHLHLLSTFASLVSLKNRDHRITKKGLISERGFTSSTLLVLWTFGGLVLTSAYTGMLFSQKVMPSTSPPFTDFESFVTCLERKKCRIIAHATSYSALQLLTAPGGELTDRVQKAIAESPIIVMPLDKVPGAILREQKVYLVWIWSESAILYAIHGNGDCAYYTVVAPYKEIYTFPLRKNSPLLRELNRMSSPFRENALAVGFRAPYGGSDRCGGKLEGMRPSGDGLHDGDMLRSMATTFLFFGIGIVAAVIALVLEAIVRRLRE